MDVGNVVDDERLIITLVQSSDAFAAIGERIKLVQSITDQLPVNATQRILARIESRLEDVHFATNDAPGQTIDSPELLIYD